MQQETLEKAQKIYGVDSGSLELLGGFDDNVYLSRDQNIVIKFLDVKKHRFENLLKELEVIKLMTTHGIHTPAPTTSRNGKVIELIKGRKGDFYIIAFSNVEGKVLLNYEYDNHLIEQWGRTLGEMHEISKRHAFKLDYSSLEWNHDINDEDFFKGTGQLIEKKWRTYMEQLSSMSCNQDNYGVVHHDLHNQNIILSGNDMYVLDFGDVRKSWFVYDVSIPIYHALERYRKQHESNGVEFYERFTKHFLKGYREKSTFSEEQYRLIPFFLEYRLLYSYLYYVNSVKANEVSTNIKKILDEMRCRIENDVPFIL